MRWISEKNTHVLAANVSYVNNFDITRIVYNLNQLIYSKIFNFNKFVSNLELIDIISFHVIVKNLNLLTNSVNVFLMAI